MAGPNEQPLPPDVAGREDAIEVLRAFVVDGGLSIAFTRAFEEPDMWGMLLVDIARHAARVYAREGDYTEEDALRRIVDLFEAEIAARIMEHAFDYLDAPVGGVSGKDVPMPYAANLEKLALPSAAEVVEAAKAVCYR